MSKKLEDLVDATLQGKKEKELMKLLEKLSMGDFMTLMSALNKINKQYFQPLNQDDKG